MTDEVIDKTDEQKKSHQKTLTRARVRLYAVIVLVLGIVIGVVSVVIWRSKSDKPINPSVIRYESRGPSKGDYDVLGTTNKKDSLRVTVVIKKLSDEQLISLNDKLLGEYSSKSKSKSLYIDYFDDPEVAKVYFAKMTDPATTVEQKKELARHYKALMVDNSTQGKKLFAIDASGRVIKTY